MQGSGQADDFRHIRNCPYKNLFGPGHVWLPYLLFIAILIARVLRTAPDGPRMIIIHEVDVPALMGLGRLALLISIPGFVIGVIVTVGPLRTALRRHPGLVYVFFSLGAPDVPA